MLIRKIGAPWLNKLTLVPVQCTGCGRTIKCGSTNASVSLCRACAAGKGKKKRGNR